MRSAVTALLGVVIAACAAVDGPLRSSQSLPELVGDRTPGTPVQCINVHDLRGNFLLPKERAVLFQGPGRTLYLNRLHGQCDNVRAGLALRINSPTGRLCAGEIIELFDPVAGVGHGACALGEYVPYKPVP